MEDGQNERRATMVDEDKRFAAHAVVAEVEDGVLGGLGAGSTVAHAIAAIVAEHPSAA